MNGTQGINNTKRRPTSWYVPRLVFVDFWLTGVLGPGPLRTCSFIIKLCRLGLGVQYLRETLHQVFISKIYTASSVQISMRWSKRTGMEGRNHGRCHSVKVRMGPPISFYAVLIII
jgi:hypothetical protein